MAGETGKPTSSHLGQHLPWGADVNENCIAYEWFRAACWQWLGEGFSPAAATAGRDFLQKLSLRRVVALMAYSAKTKTLSAVCFTLLLLLCGSGGCLRARHSELSGCGESCLCLFRGGTQQCAPVYVVGSECYGYEATCWSPWPEQCGGCPIDPMLVGTQIDITGENELNAADGPHPAGVPMGPASPGPNAADWEVPPVPDSDADFGIDKAPSPPAESQKNAKSSPFSEEVPRSDEDDTGRPPEMDGARPLKIEEQPPEPPIQDGTTFQAGAPALRFVSFSASEAPTANEPGTTSRTAEGNAGESTRRTPNEGEHRDEDLAWHRADGSPPREEQERSPTLEALKTSFSSPAPRYIRLPKPNRPRARGS